MGFGGIDSSRDRLLAYAGWEALSDGCADRLWSRGAGGDTGTGDAPDRREMREGSSLVIISQYLGFLTRLKEFI